MSSLALLVALMVVVLLLVALTAILVVVKGSRREADRSSTRPAPGDR